MDSMLQLKVIGQITRDLPLITRIERISIDTSMHYNTISKMNSNSTDKSIEVRVYSYIDAIR